MCKWETAGGLGEALFYFEVFEKLENFILVFFTKYKMELPKSPHGPPSTYIFEKYGISDFTRKKNYPSRDFCSVFTFF